MKSDKDKLIKTILLIVGILIVPLLSAHAEDLRLVTQFQRYWKFSVGDRMEWAEPGFDDSDWDQIRVPERWEDQGYNDYNGFAWYRTTFRLPRAKHQEQLYVVLGRIDDCDEVYINGTLIGKSGIFPPYFETAFDIERKYPLPSHLLNENGNNVIAVRVYDSYLEGGFIDGRVGIFYDDDIEYLNVDLTGSWKFRIGNEREWRDRNFDDSDWEEIHVPASWESQGYEEYDGYAWYRTKFRLPASLRNEQMYLSLGKIDDYDRVYLNGEEIGEVFDLPKDSEYRRKGYEFNARRVYEIPVDLLSENGSNTIAIRVYDKHGIGGIYEGPIGIMDRDNYKDYSRKHYDSRGFWDFIMDSFVD